jgi:thymidylate kinase
LALKVEQFMIESSRVPDAMLENAECAASMAETVKIGTGEACNVAGFLRSLFRLLDEACIRYCVLHSWKDLPGHLLSDLDLVVHPQDGFRLPGVLRSLRSEGYSTIQCFNYYTNAYYFVFYWFEELNSKTAAVDIIFDHRRSGLVFSHGAEMVAGRRRYNEIWVPSPENEFRYLLVKKAWKGEASVAQSDRLRALVQELGLPTAEEIAAEFFRGRWKAQAVEACTTGSVEKQLGRSRAKFWWLSVSRRPFQLIGFLAAEGLRAVRRVFQPTGMLVAAVGPDGAGKSTVIAGLLKSFQRSFRLQRVFHWRPQVFAAQKNQGSVTDPHGKSPRGALLSMAALSACFFDYWFGYLFVIRPLLSKSCFVIFDRYFHDVLVDPKRYRYGGPQWFSQFLARLVPEPDMVMFLDSDPETVLTRKTELPVSEVRRQLEAYRGLQFQHAKEVVVRTDAGIRPTLRASASAVAEFLEQRLERRMRNWKRAEA